MHNIQYIGDEIRKLIHVLIVTIIFQTLLSTCLILRKFVDCEWKKYDPWLRIGDEICVIFTCLSTVYIQTKWIMGRINKQAESLEAVINANESLKQYDDNEHNNNRNNICKNIYYNLPPSLSSTRNHPKVKLFKAANIDSNSYQNGGKNSKYSPANIPQYNGKNANAAIEMPQIQENMATDLHKISYTNSPDSISKGDVDTHYKNKSDSGSNTIGTQSSTLNTNSSPMEVEEEKIEEKDEYDRTIYRMIFEILSEEKLFDSLTRHLASEFSMECSFAFIEFTQFRRLLETDIGFMSHVNFTEEEKDPSPQSFINIHLPSTISRSSIVHNKKYARMIGTDRYRKIAKKLTEKYLQRGAEFELAINKNTKKECVDWVDHNCKYFRKIPKQDHSSVLSSQYSSNSDPSTRYSSRSVRNDDLYHLFEKSRKEIYHLMAHSCYRYVILKKKLINPT